MWLEHCYCYFQLYSATLLKSRKVQVFRCSLLTEYGQDKHLQISNLWRNSFRLLLNFPRRHRLVNENALIFVAIFVALTKLSELSSHFSSRQRKLKWLRQRKFSSSSSLTKKHWCILYCGTNNFWTRANVIWQLVATLWTGVPNP